VFASSSISKIERAWLPRYKYPGRAKFLPKRSSPRWGEQAVMREQGSAGPANTE